MALSANTALPLRNTNAASRYSLVIKTGQKIYKHAIVYVAAGNGLAYAGAAFTATTMRYAGLATAECATGNGTRTVEMMDDVEVQLPLRTSVTKGMVNDALYAWDDERATNLTTHGPQIGVLREWTSANLGWVKLRGAVMSDGT